MTADYGKKHKISVVDKAVDTTEMARKSIDDFAAFSLCFFAQSGVLAICDRPNSIKNCC